MGNVTIQEETTKYPITLMGKESGICYGSDTSDDEKNYKRGLGCLKANHGRVLEYPQIYLVIDGYSARVIRELYTHIAGAPSRLQASTRYINYDEFGYIIPPSIEQDIVAKREYMETMKKILDCYTNLTLGRGIPKEDAANILPLGMSTKLVFRTNLRHLIDMSHQRMCTRAYWEYRDLMLDIIGNLREYSDEWKYLVDNGYFCPKCEVLGYCPETHSCGRKIRKNMI